MSYLVLARKWRPQRFDDVVGQSHVTRVLRNAISAGRIAHAYLFTGVRGVGKTTAARILAKALNCEKGPAPEPCNRCNHCGEITTGNSIDVYEIDGASNTGIDNVREIIENTRYQPAKGRFKIYIIDEVHQISKAAFNALLKTLEEPPPFIKFILATTEVEKIPETILSRCQRFDFRRIPVREIQHRLGEIAEKEGLRITQGALLLLAREAGGSMRDAQSLLEQVLSYALPEAGGPGGPAEIGESLLQDVLGIGERRVLYDLSGAVIRGDAKRCLELVAEVTVQGRDIVRMSREMVEHFRNLLVVRLAQPRSSVSSMSGLLDLPDQEIEDLERQVSGLSVETLMDYFSLMAEGDEEVGRSANPRFALEAVLTRLAILPRTVPVLEILGRLETMEGRLSAGAGGASRSFPNSKEAGLEGLPAMEPGLGRAPAQSSGGDDKTGETWKSFVSFVMKEKKLLASHLDQVRPLSLPPGQLMIGVEDRHHLSYLQDPETLSSLKDFARRYFSGEVAVTIAPLSFKKQSHGDEPMGGAGSPGNDRDPAVRETLRIFGGTIVEVKKGN